MSSGETDGMSAQAAADDEPVTPFASLNPHRTPPNAAHNVTASRQSSSASAAAAAAAAASPDNGPAAGLDDAGQDPPHAQQAAGGSAGGGVAGSNNSVAPPARSASDKSEKKKVIPLRQVLRHSYEYHGLNELFMFCITAVAVTLVLYWHWGRFTPIFKASVQQSFQSYGNPDWQSQSMHGVETMNDAVQYSMGWLEFWIQRADYIDLPGRVIRAQDYGDVLYARVLVNLDRNCDRKFSPHLTCYKQDPIYKDMLAGVYGNYSLSHARNTYPACKRHRCPHNPDLNTVGYSNLLEWAGWVNVFQLYNRLSLNVPEDNYWWAYTVIAPKYYGQKATRDNYIGRLYNITRQTSLNVNNCDWLAQDCSYANNQCANENVPFNNWFANNTAMCPNGTNTKDDLRGPGVYRGNRTFVRDPTNSTRPQGPGDGGILDLSAYLSKYAYSIVVDLMAANTLGDYVKNETNYWGAYYNSNRDRALFSLMFQRSAEAGHNERPTRVMWQISSTVPVRTGFYVNRADVTRSYCEALLYCCLIVVLFFQVWQFRVCRIQFGSWKPFFAHCWNDYEIISTLLLISWIIYYFVLLGLLASQYQHWNLDQWDMVTTRVGEDIINPHWELETLATWANAYSAWLYMGIAVDFLIFVRVARYMRVHVGLKAFYQVFIIAGREFMDFAVFFFFILVLLGTAIFAFFQLTGGNYQFLRFADGLAVMTRLTFGFLDYGDFQGQALGVGAAVSAVTFLFWLAVVLLVVYTQNIILAIVAEAYEEAKAKLGTAETSFLVLVIMRVVFFFSYIVLRVIMLCQDMRRRITGRRQLTHPQLSGTHPTLSPSADGASQNGPGNGPGGDGGATSGDDPGPSGGRATRNSKPAFTALARDVAAHSDQNQPGGSPDPPAANGHPPAQPPTHNASGNGRGNGDVEMGLQPGPVSSLAAPRTSSTRRALLLIGPLQSGGGWIAAWKRHYLANWCIARTKSVKALMSIYQDFSSYKLKEECTWPQAQELFDSIPVAPDSTPAGAPWQCQVQGLTFMDTKGVKFHMKCEAKHSCEKVLTVPLPGLDPAAVAAIATGSKQDAASHGVTFTYELIVPDQCKAALARGLTIEQMNQLPLFGAAATADAPVIGYKLCFAPQKAMMATVQLAVICSRSCWVYDINLTSTDDLPPLTDVSYVDEDTLRRLLILTSKMSKEVPVWLSPFREVKDDSIADLVRNISDVYGVSEDEAVLQQEGLGSAQGSLVSSGGSVDARLGQVARRGAGFFGQLNVMRREGGPEIKQLTMLLHAQRRLEHVANKTESNLKAHRTHADQLAGKITDRIKQQQEEQAEILKVLRTLPAVQEAATGQQRSRTASSSIDPLTAASTQSFANRSSKWDRARSLLPGIGGSAASRAGTDMLPARRSSTLSAGSGTSRASSDASQLGITVAALHQQMMEQKQTMTVMKTMQDQIEKQQRQMMDAMNAMLHQQGRRD